jgi:hypothetical protein
MQDDEKSEYFVLKYDIETNHISAPYKVKRFNELKQKFEEDKKEREKKREMQEAENKRRQEEQKRQQEETTKQRRQKSGEIINQDITCFFHLTSKENVSSILKNGILPKNQVKSRGLLKKDLSWENMQKRRDSKEIGLTNGERHNLHDLVPFYFIPKTPNNFRMWETDKEIVLICVAKQIIYSAECSYAFSDCNVTSDYAQTYTDLINLDQLDWKTLKDPFPNYVDWEIKRKRMAELLVYPSVSPKFIEKIIVPTEQMKSEIENYLKQAGLNIDVQVYPRYFG